MQQLIEGVHRFAADEFGRYRELFQRLSREGQQPHTLFITCSDSRVIAELLTQSHPGDLFVVKNVGNIVPPSHVRGETNSTAAAIEFAVEVLGVRDVVVCGHSQCGAIHALLQGVERSDSKRHLVDWIEVAAPVRKIIETNYRHLTDTESRLRAAEEENVLFALENLKTYPCVEQKIAQRSLRIHGWFFRIATAELYAYDPVLRQFAPLVEQASLTTVKPMRSEAPGAP